MRVKHERSVESVEVVARGEGLTSRAGAALVAGLADRVGLSADLSVAFADVRERRSRHDPARVVRDLALTRAEAVTVSPTCAASATRSRCSVRSHLIRPRAGCWRRSTASGSSGYARPAPAGPRAESGAVAGSGNYARSFGKAQRDEGAARLLDHGFGAVDEGARKEAIVTGETVGQRVRRLREERGLSQRDVEAPGVSYARHLPRREGRAAAVAAHARRAARRHAAVPRARHRRSALPALRPRTRRGGRRRRRARGPLTRR